jgi:hypothetical protein
MSASDRRDIDHSRRSVRSDDRRLSLSSERPQEITLPQAKLTGPVWQYSVNRPEGSPSKRRACLNGRTVDRAADIAISLRNVGGPGVSTYSISGLSGRPLRLRSALGLFRLTSLASECKNRVRLTVGQLQLSRTTCCLCPISNLERQSCRTPSEGPPAANSRPAR